MNHTKLNTLIEEQFRRRVRKDPKIHNAYLHIHSSKLDIDLKLAEGSTNSLPAHAQQPFHIASITKLFTAVVFGIFAEANLCSYEDPISSYVDRDILHNLHIYKGTNYTNDIKIKHLLNHTSGLHDFMEDRPKLGPPMVDMILNDLAPSWEPVEIIAWAKSHLTTRFPPGKGFHYSDTGYHLLGLIIEKLSGKHLHEVFHTYIFEPLEMKSSYFGHYSKPAEKNDYPIANIYLRNIDITHNKSTAITYAGGAVISTGEDLLAFMKALVNNKLITEETIVKMKRDSGRFAPGIDYGYGLMNFKTVPILMPSKFNSWGNAGSTGSFMFYHPATDSYLIGSFNHSGYGSKGIRFMLRLINKLTKYAPHTS